MLWQGFNTTETPVQWTVYGSAVSKREECVSDQRTVWRFEKEKQEKAWGPLGRKVDSVEPVQIIVSGDKGVMFFEFKCLPDTVDPRGPKRK